jgi:hypothetical protein
MESYLGTLLTVKKKDRDGSAELEHASFLCNPNTQNLGQKDVLKQARVLVRPVSPRLAPDITPARTPRAELGSQSAL